MNLHPLLSISKFLPARVKTKVKRIVWDHYGLNEQPIQNEPPIHEVSVPPTLNREMVASTYLQGDGIEIGALHNPLPVPETARVKYVDRMTVADLRKQYPELDSSPLIKADIIADGELLETIEDGTQDFVIANHFLEHCQNPINAIINMLRVLRPDGILYMAIPDKRYTFDVERPITPLDHLMKDYREGPEWSREQHFVEWAQLWAGKDGGEATVEAELAKLIKMDYSIHFHVWTADELMELLLALKKDLRLSFEVELFFQHIRHEVITIVRKTAVTDAQEASSM